MDFVVRPNAEAAGDDSLVRKSGIWDMRYFEFVAFGGSTCPIQGFKQRLEQVKDDYAYVVEELQASDFA